MAVCEEYVNGLVTLRQRGKFFRGETVDVLQPGTAPFTAGLEEIWNENREPIASAPHAEMKVYWRTGAPVVPGAYLRVKRAGR